MAQRTAPLPQDDATPRGGAVEVFEGMVRLVALAGMSDVLRNGLDDDMTPDALRVRIARASERVGLLHVFSDWTRSYDLMTGGLGPELLASAEMRSQEEPEAIGGDFPFLRQAHQQILDAVQLAHGIPVPAGTAEPGPSQVHAMRMLVPLSNWRSIRRLFDRVRDAAPIHFGRDGEGAA